MQTMKRYFIETSVSWAAV